MSGTGESAAKTATETAAAPTSLSLSRAGGDIAETVGRDKRTLADLTDAELLDAALPAATLE